MKLIVGLGNPGRVYEKTRHNIGFMIVNEIAKTENQTFTYKPKFKGSIMHLKLNDDSVIFLKPKTFMNLSGESVALVKKFYNIDIKDILVIYDDLDLPCGKLRFRRQGSSGGHNGLKSIINCIESQEFNRLKIGIERDQVIPVVDYVLGKFSKEQLGCIKESIGIGINVIYDWLNFDDQYVMNKYN